MDVYFFFFKQKTAYEMRISDWSSDVCSSDLSHVTETCAMTLQRAQSGRDHRRPETPQSHPILMSFDYAYSGIMSCRNSYSEWLRARIFLIETRRSGVCNRVPPSRSNPKSH